MVFGISTDSVWKAYDGITGVAGGLRTHVNTAVGKVTGGIDQQLTDILDSTHGQETPVAQIDKGQVEILIDKIYSGCSYGKTAALVSMLGLFIISQYAPYFSGIFQVGALISLIAANEFNEMLGVVWEAEKEVKNEITGDKIRWAGQLEDVATRCSELLQSRLYFFNRSLFFGEEIRLLPDYIGRKIVAAEDPMQAHADVKWVPDRKEGQGSVRDYIDKIKANVTQIAVNLQQNDAEEAKNIQILVQEALRPLAFTRSTLATTAITLYTASAILPFSSLFLLGSIATAFFAYELHQVHESIRVEVSEKLFENWKENVDTADVTQWAKNACLRIEKTTWIFHRDFMFGKEIKLVPDYLTKLIAAKGAFDDKSVTDIDMTGIASVLDTIKNWVVYQAPWTRE